MTRLHPRRGVGLLLSDARKDAARIASNACDIAEWLINPAVSPEWREVVRCWQVTACVAVGCLWGLLV